MNQINHSQFFISLLEETTCRPTFLNLQTPNPEHPSHLSGSILSIEPTGMPTSITAAMAQDNQVHTIPIVSIFSEGGAFRMNRTLHSEQGRLHAYEMMTHTHVAQQIDNINPSVMKFFRSLMPGGSLLRFGYL